MDAKQWLEDNAPDYVKSYVKALRDLNAELAEEELRLTQILFKQENTLLKGMVTINEIEQELRSLSAEREAILHGDPESEDNFLWKS